MKHCQKFLQGQIWFADFDDLKMEKGVTSKSRPVLIISGDEVNVSSGSVNVVPLSTSPNSLKWHSVKIEGSTKDSYALINQMRTVNKMRLKQYMSTISQEKLYEIIQAYNQFILNYNPNPIQNTQSKPLIKNNIKQKHSTVPKKKNNNFINDIVKMPLSRLAKKYNMSIVEAEREISKYIGHKI